MSLLAEFDDGLKLREADHLADVQRLIHWIDADPAHRGIFSPGYFMSGKLAEDPRPTCYALEDEDGVVFYIRLSRAARVRIQFAPEGDRRQRVRVARGLIHGMAFLEAGLAQARAEEWIFATESRKLKTLAQQVLGFTESTHEMVRAISRPEE